MRPQYALLPGITIWTNLTEWGRKTAVTWHPRDIGSASPFKLVKQTVAGSAATLGCKLLKFESKKRQSDAERRCQSQGYISNSALRSMIKFQYKSAIAEWQWSLQPFGLNLRVLSSESLSYSAIASLFISLSISSLPYLFLFAPFPFFVLFFFVPLFLPIASLPAFLKQQGNTSWHQNNITNTTAVSILWFLER